MVLCSAYEYIMSVATYEMDVKKGKNAAWRPLTVVAMCRGGARSSATSKLLTNQKARNLVAAGRRVAFAMPTRPIPE